MPRAKRYDGQSFIVRDAAAEAAIIADEVRALEAELSSEQAMLDACKTFLVSFDAYVSTFPYGLDPCDPDRELENALDFSLSIHRAGVAGMKTRLKDARVRLKRAGERRFTA